MNPSDLDPDPATGERRVQPSRCTYATIETAIGRITSLRNDATAEQKRLEEIPDQCDDKDISFHEGRADGLQLALNILGLVKP